jgi:hypothetical protein
MRKQVAVHMMQDLLPIVQKLLESDVPDVYITDDRGGTGCWIIVAQADFLPALVNLPFVESYEWENVPQHEGYYQLGSMPDEE